MKYIGIDQSYSGFALSCYDGDTGDATTQVKAFPPARYGTGIDRLLAIGAWTWTTLSWVTSNYPGEVAHVCMEGYSAGSKFGRESAGELGATVKRTLHMTLAGDVKYPTIVAPTSLKKFVLGKGTGGKNEMLLGVYKKWDEEFSDDNAADAYALARLAHAIVEDSYVHWEYEREVIEKLRVHTERPVSP